MKRNLSVGAVALLILLLWRFPDFWYAGHNEDSDFFWFEEQAEIAGWEFVEHPVGDAAEAILAADLMSNGEFQSGDGSVVRVFSAKRYFEKKNATGLLTHTPDICWTKVGLQAVPQEPYHATKNLDGVELVMERRVFAVGDLRELVYFGAVVGGKPLPYRLDQFLAAALGETVTHHRDGPISRFVNPRVWTWCLDSFVKRTRLAGPQQLIRISTPIDSSLEVAEQRIDSVLALWLQSVPYSEKIASSSNVSNPE